MPIMKFMVYVCRKVRLKYRKGKGTPARSSLTRTGSKYCFSTPIALFRNGAAICLLVHGIALALQLVKKTSVIRNVQVDPKAEKL